MATRKCADLFIGPVYELGPCECDDPGPAEFARGWPDDDIESDNAYAMRVNAAHLGRPRPAPEGGRSAEFGGATAMDAPPAGAGAPPAASWVVPQLPAPAPSDEEESEFLNSLRGHLGAGRLRAELVAAVGAVEVRLATQGKHFGHTPDLVRRAAVDATRFRAMLAAVEGAPEDGPIDYTAPDPADVAAVQGGTMVKLALASAGGLAALVRAALGRRAYLMPRAEQDSASLRAMLAGFAGYGRAVGDDLEAAWYRYHRTASDLRAMRAEVESIESSLAALPAALAEAVGGAIAGAGGVDEVARGVAASSLLGTAGPDPDAPALAELAGVADQLTRLGATPTSPGPDRAAAALQARYKTLSAELESARATRRTATAARAKEDVAAALAGSVESLAELTATVARRPDAFAGGLLEALRDAPRKALEEVGHSAFASIPL